MARIDLTVTPLIQLLQFNGGGTNHPIEANNGHLYEVYIDGASDVSFRKSTDDGLNWSAPTVIRTGSAIAVACWYGRNSGVADDLIHVAYIDSNTVFYRSIDTASSDALGTETTIFAGASSAGGGALTIWRSRGTNTLRCVYNIDNGTEDGTASSTDLGATWGDTIADATEGATQDQFYGFPGHNADANDEMLLFVDASANGWTLKRYDDSANTWSEVNIIADGGFVDTTAATSFPHVAGFVDVANSRNVVAGWSAVDAANADLRAFILTDGAVTETAANAVLNSTDDQGLCAFGLNTATGTWYIFYAGKSDGSETWNTSVNLYYKTSTDDGATWSAETLLTNRLHNIAWLATMPRFTQDFAAFFIEDIANATHDALRASVLLPSSGGGLAVPMFAGGVIQ